MGNYYTVARRMRMGKAVCESKGLKLRKSKTARTCNLCWVHSSRYIRECPVCHLLFAPECRPMRCWSDEFNHCRNCHALIEMLKHCRLISQYPHYYCASGRKDKWKSTEYMNLPVGVQINILSYAFQSRTSFGQIFITRN